MAEHKGKYPVLPAPPCPVCEKGNLILWRIEHGSIHSYFRWKCSNPDCYHTVG